MLQVIINEFTLPGITADKARGQHSGLRECSGGADPVRDILTLQPVIGHDPQRITAGPEPATQHVGHAGNPRCIGQAAQVIHLEGELVDLDPVNQAHPRTPSKTAIA